MSIYYKFTSAGGSSYGGYQWPLPVKNTDGTWTPGEWTPAIEGELKECANGYHYTDADWLAAWIDAELYEIEIDGESIVSSETHVKYICRRARLLRRIEGWNDKTARLFAVRCARDAMTHVPNPDPRSIAAIDTAERYAVGIATVEELDAASAAAWAAARAAARDADRAAARDADSAAASAADSAAASAADSAAASAAASAADSAAASAAARAAARAAVTKKYSGWLLEATK